MHEKVREEHHLDLYATKKSMRVENGTTKMSEDNRGAKRCFMDGFHRSTHFAIHIKFIGELLEDGSISVEYCKTEMKILDLFTKSLPETRHSDLCEKIGIDLIGIRESRRCVSIVILSYTLLRFDLSIFLRHHITFSCNLVDFI